jgi:hypothetical protein
MMTLLPRIEAGDVDSSVPESGYQLEWYSSTPPSWIIGQRKMHRAPESDRSSEKYYLSLSYPVLMPKPSSHRMHDPGSIVPHIRPKVLTDKQMS